MASGCIVAAPPCSLYGPCCSSVHKRTKQNVLGNLKNFKVRLARRIWVNFATQYQLCFGQMIFFIVEICIWSFCTVILLGHVTWFGSWCPIWQGYVRADPTTRARFFSFGDRTAKRFMGLQAARDGGIACWHGPAPCLIKVMLYVSHVWFLRVARARYTDWKICCQANDSIQVISIYSVSYYGALIARGSWQRRGWGSSRTTSSSAPT